MKRNHVIFQLFLVIVIVNLASSSWAKGWPKRPFVATLAGNMFVYLPPGTEEPWAVLKITSGDGSYRVHVKITGEKEEIVGAFQYEGLGLNSKFFPLDGDIKDKVNKTIIPKMQLLLEGGNALISSPPPRPELKDEPEPTLEDAKRIIADLKIAPLVDLSVEPSGKIITSFGAAKEGTIETRTRATATAPQVTKTENTQPEHQSPESNKKKRVKATSETPWDVNGDNVVNIFDLTLVGSDFGKNVQQSKNDVDQNGVVDNFDLNLIVQHFGEVSEVIDRNEIIRQNEKLQNRASIPQLVLPDSRNVK